MLNTTACTNVTIGHLKVSKQLQLRATRQVMSMSKAFIVTPLMQGGVQQWGTLLYNYPNLTSFTGLNYNWKTVLALLSNKTKQVLGSEGIMFISGSGTWTCKTYPK